MNSKEPHQLESVLEAILQSHNKTSTDQNRLIEHGTEMDVQGQSKIAEKISDIVKVISDKKDEGVRTVKLDGISVITLKGDPGDDGKPADEEKIIATVSEKLPKKEDIIAEVIPTILEKVPKIEDIVAQVVPKIEPGAPGEPGDDGDDADPDEVATLLKNDPDFVAKTKGEPGAPGNNGSADTAEQIVLKISSLTDEKRLSYFSLKDLPEIFKKPNTTSGGGFIKDMADVSILSEPTNGQALAWSSTLKKWIATTISGGGGGTPGGSAKQIQFNNSGAFGGASDFVYDFDATQSYVGLGTDTPRAKFDISVSSDVYIPGTGTIDDDGTGLITGSGTAFLSELQVGDMIHDTSMDSFACVVEITDDFTMRVEGSLDSSGYIFEFLRPIQAWRDYNGNKIAYATSNSRSGAGFFGLSLVHPAGGYNSKVGFDMQGQYGMIRFGKDLPISGTDRVFQFTNYGDSTEYFSWDIDTSGNPALNSHGKIILLGKAPAGSFTEQVRLNQSGQFGINTGASVAAKLHVIETTEQFRLGYNASNYYKTTVGSTGGVTFDAVGSGAKFTFNDQTVFDGGSGKGTVDIIGTGGGDFRIGQSTTIASGYVSLTYTSPKLGLTRSGTHFLWYDTGNGNLVLNNTFGGSSYLSLAYGGTDVFKVDSASSLTALANLTISTKNIVTDTTTGTKIGTGTTQKLGFWNATPVVQQTDGANLTNSVTSGGTTDTIANFTDLVIYANDAATIRNDIYQLARKVKIIGDALRTYGFLS